MFEHYNKKGKQHAIKLHVSIILIDDNKNEYKVFNIVFLKEAADFTGNDTQNLTVSPCMNTKTTLKKHSI